MSTNLTNVLPKPPKMSFFERPEARGETMLWLFQSLFVSYMGVWVPFVIAAVFGKFRWEETFLEGGLPMIAVSSSAAAFSFFMKEGRVELRRQETLTYIFLFGTIIAGVLLRSCLSLYNTFKPNFPTPIFWLVTTITIVLSITAIILNFRLFVVQMSNPAQVDVRAEMDKPAEELSALAKKTDTADGINLTS